MAKTSTPDPSALTASFHQVTPAMAGSVSVRWALGARHGVAPALPVVPDWHGQWPLERHPSFLNWLRQRVDEGAGSLAKTPGAG